MRSLIDPLPPVFPLAVTAVSTIHFLFSCGQHLMFMERFSTDVVPVLMVLRSPLNWKGAFVIVEGVLKAEQPLVSPLSGEDCAAWRVGVQKGMGLRWDAGEEYGRFAGADQSIFLEDESQNILPVRIDALRQIMWRRSRTFLLKDVSKVAELYAKLGVGSPEERARQEWEAGWRKWEFQEG